MKVKSLKIGILVNLFITLIIGVMNFLVNKYFVNYMGMTELGLMKLFTQLIAYLSLAELGMGTAASYSLYKPLAEKNEDKISVVISTIENIYLKISIFVFLLGIIFNLFIPFFVKNIQVGLKINLYWSLYVLNTSLSYLYAKYIVFYTANQEYEILRVIQGFSKIFCQLIQIYLLITTRSFMLFILLITLENIIQWICLRYIYQKKYSYIKKVKERERGISKDLVNLFWHKVGAVIVFNTDYSATRFVMKSYDMLKAD